MSLNGKVALITGGGTGIGAAIAERFVAEGVKVCITGRRKEKLEQEAGALPEDSVVICSGDVSNYEDVNRMISTTLAINGKIDILVNNAASDVQAPITDLAVDDWKRVLDINLTGPFQLMKGTIPHMIKNGGGTIINISSIGGFRCMPGAPAYATSKAGLIMLTKQAALEYGPYKVRCNVVCPGATRTQMFEELTAEIAKDEETSADEIVTRFSSHVPLRRAAEPSEIASACYFLASEDSSFITGSILVVDGGALTVDVSGASVRG
jgi:NAD(P)-dependent dehydrogenase (short-subunit alcohol dehydrogenase family)